MIQTQLFSEPLVQQVCKDWEKNGYSVKSVYENQPGRPYHLVIEREKHVLHAVVKYTKSDFIGISKKNIEFLNSAGPENRFVLLVQEQNYAVVPFAVEQKAKFVSSKVGYWDKTGQKKHAFHIYWKDSRLELKTKEGRIDISRFVNKCKLVIEKVKVRLHKPLWLPRPNAKYHGCYSVGFEKYLPEWLGTDNYAQLFAGMCKTGFRIDVNPQVKPDLLADVENLELSIPDEHFEATMADPPYNEDFAKRLYNCKYPKWSKWTREMVRITKIGGRIGIMQNYIVPAPKGCVFEDVYCVYGRIKQFPKIVTVFRRVR